MEGNLRKWTNFVLGWRQRYFVLKGSVLLYYQKKGQKPAGRIHLSVSNINPTNNDFRFEIDTGTSLFYLRAQTKEIKDEWIKALRIAKFESDSKIINNTFNNNNNIINRTNSRLQNFNNNTMFNNDTTRGGTFFNDDKITKKLGFIKELSENIMNLNLDLENFLRENKFNFLPENFSCLTDFLKTYNVGNILLLFINLSYLKKNLKNFKNLKKIKNF